MPDTVQLGGLVLAGVLAAGVTWWARGFLHHALRQARGRRQAPQPWRAYGHAVVSEAKAALSVLVNRAATWYQEPPSPPHDPQAGPPVLLVPDPSAGWSSMARMARLLREHGFTNVHLVDSSRAERSIEDQGTLVRDRLEEVTGDAGSLAVGIAHGAGGLALRWAMGRAQGPLLAHAIFVGTPHEGTRRPALRGVRRDETAEGSSVLAGLDEDPLVPSTSVFSHVDDRVVPARSARWGDQAIAVPGLGHWGLVWEDRSTRMILAALVAPLAEGQGPRGDPDR